jgi:acid phosphatase
LFLFLGMGFYFSNFLFFIFNFLFGGKDLLLTCAKNQVNGANDYVRKHNPAVIYDTTAGSIERLAQMKNLTQFYADLEADKLPQWMFITPNMTSDGHDTSVTVAGAWTRNFLEPLLNNPKFMKNTLVLVTFDENHTYTQQNRILGILLGDAVPAHRVGTTDSNYYNHYSEIATVEANWDLPTLGRWDVGANVYKVVAEKTGDQMRHWSGSPEFHDMFFNYSYSGPFNDIKAANVWVPPNVDACYAGREVAPWIKKAWQGVAGSYYTTKIEIPDGYHAPKGFAV